MTPNQAAKAIEKRINQLQQKIARDLPRVVGKHAVDFYRDSFHNGGFTNNGLHPWQPSKRIGTAKGAAGKYGTLLSRRKELYNSIHAVPSVGRVKIQSLKPYAGLHNYGGTVHPTVTPKMRKFAWAMHYKTVGTAKKRKNDFTVWKGLALTRKKKLSINIHKRQFLGVSRELNDLIQREVTGYVSQLFNK